MKNIGFSVFLTWNFTALYEKCDSTGQMKDIRLPIAHVLLMLSRWQIVLHDESVWKNFQSNIAWGVDELHQTFWFELFFNGRLCCNIHDSWVCRLYFSGLVCSVLYLDECLIKINYGRFCLCFRCLEKVILWSRLCLARDEFRYPSLACLFDFNIWNEWFTEVRKYDAIY